MEDPVKNNPTKNVNKAPKIANKKKVLEVLFQQCLKRGDLIFTNDELRKAADKVGFANPFDAVKIDHSALLPESILKSDHYLIHLGTNMTRPAVTQHRFVKGVSNGFHAFEEIPESEELVWKYQRSVLNERDTSESNILSIGFNQRIIHDFLYKDLKANPKVYNARRTKRVLEYRLNNETVHTNQLQMEIDMTCELNGRVTVFEGKNGSPKDFAVYQLFHPYLHFLKERDDISKNPNAPQIQEVDFCYLLKNSDKNAGETIISMYLYKFDEPDPASIKYVKSARYRLVKR